MLNRRDPSLGGADLPSTKADGWGDSNSHFVGAVGVLVEEAAPDLEQVRYCPEWQLACRVAASKRLCKSDLLPRFLLYVCEQQLTGNRHEITEQRIGTQIFSRKTGYNPGEDNIVRSYARMLRTRLDECFEGEGSDEPMRIVIPRGGYIPMFVAVANANLPDADFPASIEGVPDPGQPKPPTESLHEQNNLSAVPRHILWRSVCLGVSFGIALAFLTWFAARLIQERKEQSAVHPIWAQLFQRNRATLIVPADSGLGILENLTGHLVPLEEYANGNYLIGIKPLHEIGVDNLNDLRRQRYTSVVSLNITSMRSRLPEFAEGRSEIRYARSITAEDLKSSNAILLGSSHTNPWVSLFDGRLNFKLQYTPEVNQSFVLNQHPAGAEQAIYRNGTDKTVNSTYGVIDYVPSLDLVGHVLIIQGLNMAGTQAAADILFNPDTMKSILQQASTSDSLQPFELLVKTSSIGANASRAQVIAARFHPNNEDKC
jgi:hypothetical protein